MLVEPGSAGLNPIVGSRRVRRGGRPSADAARVVAIARLAPSLSDATRSDDWSTREPAIPVVLLTESRVSETSRDHPHPQSTSPLREDLRALRAGRRRWVILALLVLAFAVRFPGVFWGANFPIDIFALHNTDEGTHLALARHLVTPPSARTTLPKYPPATAVPVVFTAKLARAVRGLPTTPLPEKHRIIMLGRAFAVVAGTLTVFAVMLLALRLA